MTMTIERTALPERVTLHEPAEGWSRDVYDRQLSTYVDENGRAPQTVTMHPETAHALGLQEQSIIRISANDEPLLVTSSDYDRRMLTLYY